MPSHASVPPAVTTRTDERGDRMFEPQTGPTADPAAFVAQALARDAPMAGCRVIIIGAGIGGLTAALSLQRHGVRVSVYEQAATLGEVGAGLVLTPNAMH